MAVSLTRLSCWWWDSKDKEYVPNGSSINSSLEWGFGLREPEILQFSFVRRTKLASTRRKVKRKWQSKEESRVDKEFDIVLEPSNDVCLSGSESNGSDVSIGWMEPHGNGFQTDDEDKMVMSLGYATGHIKLIPDKAAAAGFSAVVFEFFYGDPYVDGNAGRLIQAWLKDHAPEMGFEDAKKVVGDLKLKGFSQIGAAGFCWGAKATIDLSKSGFIQAAMVLHPSFITLDNAKEVKVPFVILGAALDSNYPPKVLKQYEEILKANTKIDSFVKVFPNVRHGWTLRYNDTDAVAVKAADEAQRDLIKWFSKQLK